MPVIVEQAPRKIIHSFKDLEVYQKSFELATAVFQMTQHFPQEERYGLATQMRNASRSIPANIAEGWAKRRYELIFKRHLLDALGSADEMCVWLDIARTCEYLTGDVHRSLSEAYEILGRRLYQLLETWKTFR